MPKIEELEKSLSQYLANPQKSERWVMYRLINPIVDFANLDLGFEAYFEFNQTSGHGTSQSVDIALLDNDTPVVLVEAKRADRKISFEQISKYLGDGMRGIVSNGYYWILCYQKESKQLSIWNSSTEKCMRESIVEIVNFIRAGRTDDLVWVPSSSYMQAPVKPKKPTKQTKARRNDNPVTVSESVNHSLAQIREHSKATEIEKAFLENFVISINETEQGIPRHGRIEFRESRVSFFNEKIPGRSKRVGRIKLGKKQPDILVLTKLVEGNSHISEIATPEPADKGPHMRRFRLGNMDQACMFGKRLGEFIFNEVRA